MGPVTRHDLARDPADGYLKSVHAHDGDRSYLTKVENDAMGRVLLQSLPNEELSGPNRTAMGYDGIRSANRVLVEKRWGPRLAA